MFDRRKVKRRFLLYYMRVFDSERREQLGNLVDITPLGAMIVSENKLPENEMYQLKIELSADVSELPFLELKALSIWCHQDIDPSLFNTGFRFQDVPAEAYDIIQNIIERYGFREN